LYPVSFSLVRQVFVAFLRTNDIEVLDLLDPFFPAVLREADQHRHLSRIGEQLHAELARGEVVGAVSGHGEGGVVVQREGVHGQAVGLEPEELEAAGVPGDAAGQQPPPPGLAHVHVERRAARVARPAPPLVHQLVPGAALHEAWRACLQQGNQYAYSLAISC